MLQINTPPKKMGEAAIAAPPKSTTTIPTQINESC
jgi:hypothetical protein